MSWTLSGLFIVGALNRPRMRKRTNRENPQTIPEQIGKIPEKSGKSQKGQKKEGQVQIGKPPRLKHPRLAALECHDGFCSEIEWQIASNFPPRPYITVWHCIALPPKSHHFWGLWWPLRSCNHSSRAISVQ